MMLIPPDARTDPDTEDDTDARPPARSRRRRGGTQNLEAWSLPILLVILVAFFSFDGATADLFRSSSNIQTVLGNQSALGVLALSSIVPLICRQFDISIGSNAALCQVAMAAAMSRFGIPLVPALVIAVMLGTLVGTVNGLLVTRFRVNALITTLGMSSVLAGIIEAYTRGQSIVAGISNTWVGLGRGTWIGVPRTTYVLAGVAIALGYVLTNLPIGRRLHLIGSSPRSAKLVGIPVDRSVVWAFSAAGFLLVAVNGNASPQAGSDLTLEALSAAFLGATAIRPGRYNIIGTLIGILFLGFGIDGLTLAGVADWIGDVFNGGALVLAVAVSAMFGRMRLQAPT
jgi:ribose transport system permease protein